MYGKYLLYNILRTERWNAHLSVPFHGWEPSNALRQTILQSKPNDFSFSADWFSVLFPAEWSLAERCLKHPSVHNIQVMKGLTYILKDEGCFFKTLGGACREWRTPAKHLFLHRQPPTVPSSMTKALHASAPAAYIYSCKAKGYGLTTIFASEVLLENIKSTAQWINVIFYCCVFFAYAHVADKKAEL